MASRIWRASSESRREALSCSTIDCADCRTNCPGLGKAAVSGCKASRKGGRSSVASTSASEGVSSWLMVERSTAAR